MNSLIWFLIIIAIVNSVSSKKKKQEQENKKPVTAQPVYRGKRSDDDEHPYAPMKLPPKYEPVAPAKPIIMPEQIKPAKTQRLKAKLKPVESGLEGISLEGMSLEGMPLEYDLSNIQPQTTAKVEKPVAAFTRDEILQGIIMSEILNKPKALRR